MGAPTASSGGGLLWQAGILHGNQFCPPAIHAAPSAATAAGLAAVRHLHSGSIVRGSQGAHAWLLAGGLRGHGRRRRQPAACLLPQRPATTRACGWIHPVDRSRLCNVPDRAMAQQPCLKHRRGGTGRRARPAPPGQLAHQWAPPGARATPFMAQCAAMYAQLSAPVRRSTKPCQWSAPPERPGGRQASQRMDRPKNRAAIAEPGFAPSCGDSHDLLAAALCWRGGRHRQTAGAAGEPVDGGSLFLHEMMIEASATIIGEPR